MKSSNPYQSYERAAESQHAKIEEFMISAEVTLWKMRKGKTTARGESLASKCVDQIQTDVHSLTWTFNLSLVVTDGADQISAINNLFLRNETYGKSALLVGNAIINFEQGTIVTEVAMSKVNSFYGRDYTYKLYNIQSQYFRLY